MCTRAFRVGVPLDATLIYITRKERYTYSQNYKDNTLRTIIWYKRACIRQTTQQPSVTVQPLQKDVKKNVVIEQVPN